MRLRTAIKISKAIGTPAACRYTKRQREECERKLDRTRDEKRNQQFGHTMAEAMGPAARAKIFVRMGQPAEALAILMQYPEGEWGPNSEAFDRLYELAREK